MKKCLVVLIAAFVFSTVGYFVPPTHDAEAAPRKITTTFTFWKKLDNNDFICESGTDVDVDRDEPPWHKIAFWVHPHNTIRVIRHVDEFIWLGIPTCW